MPYLTKEGKKLVNAGGAQFAGDLNYQITMLIQNYIGEDFNYQKLNDVLGALEGAKLEFVRRIVNPYEDMKIKENGDVYPEKYQDISTDELQEIINMFYNGDIYNGK